jgi:hypothetical protein
LLRAVLLETAAAAPATDECHVLECNLDDTTPELIGALIPQLLIAGALDAWTTAIQMKRQRPGVLLSVLCHVSEKPVLLNLIFRGSTTFGVREYAVQRTMLERRFEKVETPFGLVRIKIGTWRGADITHAPEMDDCVALAQKNDVSVRTVYETANRFPRLGKKKQPVFQALEKKYRRKAK